MGRTIVTVLLVLALGGAGQAAAAPAKRALVTWKVGTETFRTYVNRLEDIRAVRVAIRRGERAGIPIGQVHRGRRENTGHRWHLRNVILAEAAIELCDGRPSDLDGNLRYWVDTVKRYCP